MREEMLGKIENVWFGIGGYNDSILGLWITLSSLNSGCVTGIEGYWVSEISERTKWTEEDRISGNGKMCNEIVDILKRAKISDVSKLKGVPVRMTFENMVLKDWKILEEVL